MTEIIAEVTVPLIPPALLTQCEIDQAGRSLKDMTIKLYKDQGYSDVEAQTLTEKFLCSVVNFLDLDCSDDAIHNIM